MNSQFDFIVVGGGISGIAAALTLAKNGCSVALIEAAPKLGGLLGSQSFFHGNEELVFDYGTHLLRDTGNKVIDDLFIKPFVNKNYERYQILKNGNFFKGKLNASSPFINANFLNPNDYTQGEIELFHNASLSKLIEPKALSEYDNCEEHLCEIFGKTFYENIHRPILKKFYGRNGNDLIPGAHSLLGLSLLMVSTPEKTRELKKDPILNSRIGFHSFHEGISDLVSYYPTNNGIGLWTEELTAKLKDWKVKLYTASEIENINSNQNRIEAVVLKNGEEIQCQHLLWTVSPFSLIKILNPNFFQGRQFEKCSTSLYHFISNEAPLTDLYYFINYEPDMLSFRTTLYSNLQNKNAHHPIRLTVEVISPTPIDPKVAEEKIQKELIQTGIFSKEAILTSVGHFSLPNGFPLPTHSNAMHHADALNYLKSHSQNLTLLGKENANLFFLNQVLTHSHDTALKLHHSFNQDFRQISL